MKVAVEIMTGSLFYVDVEDDINATVADLKRAIASQEKLPFERLILLLHGDHEEENGGDDDDDGDDGSTTLAEFGVQDGSHVYLFLAPVDDGGSACDSIFSWPEAFF